MKQLMGSVKNVGKEGELELQNLKSTLNKD